MKTIDKGLMSFSRCAGYYSPDTGRFLSEDPIGFEGGDYNLYRYVKNKPLEFVDPKGENAQIIVKVITLGAELLGLCASVETCRRAVENILSDPPGPQPPRKSCDPSRQSCTPRAPTRSPKPPKKPILPVVPPKPPICPR